LDSILVRGSASGRPGLTDLDRRQLRYLDAVRLGAVDLAEELAGSDPAVPLWQVDWATGTDLDPRLHLKVHVGPVTAMAFGVLGQRPVLAVGSHERGPRVGESSHRLHVWDVLSGQSRELPCDDPVRCLSFATLAEDPVLVTGHAGGWLRIWDVPDVSLRTTVYTGDDDLVELYVAESGGRARAVTRDSQWRVQCWSLPTGEQVRVPDGAQACSLYGGWLADGRRVLLMGGDGLSLWDLDGSGLRSLPVPQESMRVRSVVLSTVDGRDCVTVVDEAHLIVTFDLATGALISAPITAHVNRRPDGLMKIYGTSSPHPKLAAVSGRLAVPTQWRVHLWNLGTSRQETPAITGPVAGCLVQPVRWQDRDLLLTGSAHDGVVALWDLALPVARPPGHDQPVCRVVLADPANAVVSADEGGTIVARHGTDGRLVAPPLATGIESTRALAAWFDGHNVIAAQGAGSRYVSDGNLRQWNLTTGEQHRPLIYAHNTLLHWLSRITLPDGEALVTFGPGGMLKIWDIADGALLAETPTGVTSKVTGFATGVIEGKPFAVLSSYGQAMALYTLDDLAAPPIIVPEAGDDIVLDVVGQHVVAAHFEYERSRPDTVRVWHISGSRIGPDIRGSTPVTTAAVRTWPAVYIGRADGTVSLTDMETGRDLCSPVLLPTRPNTMTVTSGDLVVGFGSDLARLRPPVG
jgi:WD40 repeat protein